MVNIFGKEEIRGKEGSRGPSGIDGAIGPRGSAGSAGSQGERGEPGTSGIVDLCSWLPFTLLDNYQINSEECCFIIQKGVDDVEMKGGKSKRVVKWKSKSMSSEVESKRRIKKIATITSGSAPCKSITYLPNDAGYLELQKSMFKVFNVCLTNQYSSICLTFKVLGDDPDQYIVSNWETKAQGRVFRGVSVSKEEIHIHGCVNDDPFTIKHNTGLWTTLFVEWSLNGGTFDINMGEKKGVFDVKEPTLILPSFVYIGGRSDNTRYFNGYLAAVEWCSLIDPSKDVHFPDYLKKLIMKSQYIDEDDDNAKPPSCKTMKVM